MQDEEQKVPEVSEVVESQSEPMAEAVVESVGEPDKTIDLGSIGKLELDFNAGIATVSISAAVPGKVGIEGGAFIKCDADQLVDALFAAIEAKLPDSADPIAETVKSVIKGAIKLIP